MVSQCISVLYTGSKDIRAEKDVQTCPYGGGHPAAPGCKVSAVDAAALGILGL